MCVDPVTIAMIGATAMQAGGQIAAGNAAAAAGKYNAGVLRKQGRAELAAANMTANDVREQGRKHGGEIAAIQGSSGTDINSGSNVDVAGADAQAYEEDALRAVYGGQIKNWGLNTEADMAIYEGKVAKRQGYIKAAGTVLSAAASSNFGGLTKTPAPSGGAPNSSMLGTQYQSTRFG